MESAQEQVTAAFQRGDIGQDKYQAFQREVEETRGKLNQYKNDLSSLQTEQDRLSSNTARLEKLFSSTGTQVDDYADVLGSKLVSAIKNGTANSDQMKTAIEKIGKSATGGKADIRQLTDALDTVDDGEAIRNLIEELKQAGDAAQDTAEDVGQIAENTKGAALMQTADQLSAVGDKIQDIGTKAMDAYSETENAVTKVNAYFGETGQAAEESANVIKSVYSDGVGESMDSVADAVIMVKKNLGDLSETDLTNLTQQAITLDELYGIDMNETLRGVNSLMQQYGLTAQEAMDSNLSLVWLTACESNCCFCATSTVFDGSSFNNLFTSLRADCVLVIEEFTPRNALSRPVVSPPISTVIPLILFPMSAPPPKKT